jgi:hypothetical protein
MTGKYTALLSIHGIGRHRRHANAGALLQALEAIGNLTDADTAATIIRVRPDIEPPRDGGVPSDVPMLRLQKARRIAGTLEPGAAYRIYEVNWSSATRATLPLRAMALWTAALLLSTFKPEPRSWLRWSRIRLARLRQLTDAAPTASEVHALAVLARAYRNFRGSLGARSRSTGRRGSGFREFVEFAKHRAGGSVVESSLSAAADAWRATRLPCEASVRRAGLTLVGGLLLVGLIAAACAAATVGNVAIGNLYRLFIPACLLLAIVGVFVLGRRFLTTIFSDVRYWTALSEIDQHHDVRNAVLESATATLRHVLADPNCTRVVIVSHSLGTAIAYDVLRAIGWYNVARREAPEQRIDMRKVDLLVTMGSPIDKLALLFETAKGRTFREEIMQESLRGDLTAEPFWVSGKQRIRWLNFWDPADPVSDPLYTPLGTRTVDSGFEVTTIENVEVANTRLSDPAASHTSYLTNPAVAARIFHEVFRPGSGEIGDNVGSRRSRAWSRFMANLALLGLATVLMAFIAGHLSPPARWPLPALRLGMAGILAGLSGTLFVARC